MTLFVRHREFHREVDGAIHWISLFPMLRRDFEREGARTFSDSLLLGYIHRGSNKPRFQYCVDSNNDILRVRAIHGDPGGELMDLDLMNHVPIPLRWKEYVYHVGSSFTVNSIP